MQVHRTIAYHPQANGLCKRFHRSLKASLRAALSDGNWVDRLPWVMLGLRSAPEEDLGGRREHISVDRLKPAHSVAGEAVLPAQVPRRGRPPSRAPVVLTHDVCDNVDPDFVHVSPASSLPAASDVGRSSRFGRLVKPPVRFRP